MEGKEMLLYRVCNETEAQAQQVGEPYQLTERKKLTDLLAAEAISGKLFMSLYPEAWRRNLNNLKTAVYNRWDYTLLLEIPDDVPLFDRSRREILHVEHHIPHAQQAIVRGIAGPHWPVPAWLPQTNESKWQPCAVSANEEEIKRLASWQPRDGRVIPIEIDRSRSHLLVGKWQPSTRDLDRQSCEDKDTEGATKTASIPHFQLEYITRVALEALRRLLDDNLPSQSLLEEYRPCKEWFLRPNEIGNIHGINHEARVLIWQEILARLLVKDGARLDRFALRWAAVTHDIRRMDDGTDPLHGQRAGNWVTQNMRQSISEPCLETVAYLNTWHVPPDEAAPQMTPELAVFKDADGLDRVRLGDLNPIFLRWGYSKHMLYHLSQALFDASEEKHLAGAGLFDCVIQAALDLRLIRD